MVARVVDQFIHDPHHVFRLAARLHRLMQAIDDLHQLPVLLVDLGMPHAVFRFPVDKRHWRVSSLALSEPRGAA
jgi:hypothetical protein